MSELEEKQNKPTYGQFGIFGQEFYSRFELDPKNIGTTFEEGLARGKMDVEKKLELNFVITCHGDMINRSLEDLQIPKEINPIILTNEIGLFKVSPYSTDNNLMSLLRNYISPEETDNLFNRNDPASVKDLYVKYLCRSNPFGDPCDIEHNLSYCRVNNSEADKPIYGKKWGYGRISYLYPLCDYRLKNISNSINFITCYMNSNNDIDNIGNQDDFITGIWQVKSKGAPDPPQYNIFDQYLSQWMDRYDKSDDDLDNAEWPLKGNLVEYFNIIVEWCKNIGYKNFKINIFLALCKETRSEKNIKKGDLVEYFTKLTHKKISGLFEVEEVGRTKLYKKDKNGKPMFEYHRWYNIKNIKTGRVIKGVEKDDIREYLYDMENPIFQEEFDTMDIHAKSSAEPPQPNKVRKEIIPLPNIQKWSEQPGPWTLGKKLKYFKPPENLGSYREPVPEYGMKD